MDDAEPGSTEEGRDGGIEIQKPVKGAGVDGIQGQGKEFDRTDGIEGRRWWSFGVSVQRLIIFGL